MEISDIGLIGLAVMGENLALNLESKGYTVSVYNRVHPDRESVVTRFVEGRGKGKCFHGTYTIEEFVESIRLPRKIMLMVKAGDPVDELIGQLLPWLSPGDVIIDGGNSDYHDTERRVKMLEEKGLDFRGRGGGVERAFHYAGWFGDGLAVSERYTTVDCGKTGRRFSLLRMDRSRWGWALREDGT